VKRLHRFGRSPVGEALLLAILVAILPIGAGGSSDLVLHETFDPAPAWEWFGRYSIETDPATGSRSLSLSAPAGGKRIARTGPLPLPGAGAYLLSWTCKTEDVSRPVTVSLRTEERVLVEFENAIQGRTSGWTDHEIAFSILPGEEELVLTLVLPGSGEAWFGDFELRFDPDFLSRPREIKNGAQRLHRSEWGEILSVYPLRKVYPDDTFSEALPVADAFELNAAANETEGIAIVLRPASNRSSVSLEISSLSGPAEIPEDCVSWRLVDSVNIPAEAIRSPYGRSGANPDPLLPAETFDSPAGENTVLLLEVRVLAGTPPGLYRGEIKIRAGSEIRIPLDLHVRNFELPAIPTLSSEASFGIRADKPGWEEEAIELVDDLIAHGHIPGRIVAIELQGTDWLSLAGEGVEIGFEAFDRVVEKWVARGVNRFVLPPVGLRRRSPQGVHFATWFGLTPFTPEFARAFSDYLGRMEKHLIERGWLDRAYLYLWDEPSEQEIPQFKELLSLAEGAAPSIETAVAGANLPNPELYGLIDAWMPNLRRQVLCKDDWARIEERQEAGEGGGAYGNNRYALDMPLTWIRLWPWTLFEHGLTSTGWYSVNSSPPPTPGTRARSGSDRDISSIPILPETGSSIPSAGRPSPPGWRTTSTSAY